jgi:hypothetical protein
MRVSKDAYLVFTIDMGKTTWHASFDHEEAAYEYLEGFRPDGSRSDPNDPDSDDATFKASDTIEFAFVVKSPYFLSFV